MMKSVFKKCVEVLISAPESECVQMGVWTGNACFLFTDSAQNRTTFYTFDACDWQQRWEADNIAYAGFTFDRNQYAQLELVMISSLENAYGVLSVDENYSVVQRVFANGEQRCKYVLNGNGYYVISKGGIRYYSENGKCVWEKGYCNIRHLQRLGDCLLLLDMDEGSAYGHIHILNAEGVDYGTALLHLCFRAPDDNYSLSIEGEVRDFTIRGLYCPPERSTLTIYDMEEYGVFRVTDLECVHQLLHTSIPSSYRVSESNNDLYTCNVEASRRTGLLYEIKRYSKELGTGMPLCNINQKKNFSLHGIYCIEADIHVVVLSGRDGSDIVFVDDKGKLHNVKFPGEEVVHCFTLEKQFFMQTFSQSNQRTMIRVYKKDTLSNKNGDVQE